MLRSHTCGEVRRAHRGQTVRLAGWLQRTRDLGGLLFLDLRDRYGLIQVVIDPGEQVELAARVRRINRESVITVTGVVRLRPPEMVNKEMGTGEVEISPAEITVLSECRELPIPFEEIVDASEELRLKYRYLELRRPYMQKHLEIRHLAATAVRRHLDSKGFWEVETPFLMKSTPEGARDFLVPSRLNRGRFYALPQSPQTYKQILMVAGIDRYFQIVRCFRDEDLRADRQPEFTQIDMELSFITEEDIFTIVEELVINLFKEAIGAEIKPDFPRMDYDDAISRYGTDKPDIRFGCELRNVTDIVSGCGFRVFDEAERAGGVVIALPFANVGLSRRQVDEVNAIARDCGLAGVVAGKWTEGALNAPLNKFLAEGKAAALQKILLGGEDGIVLFAAGDRRAVLGGMGKLRLKLGEHFGLPKAEGFLPLFVVDFPLFELDEAGRITSSHHPFTSPLEEDIALLNDEPLKVRSRAYDLVINGYETASGSIRIHRRELQERIFQKLGMGKEEAEAKFGFLLKAFEYGVPPHGGVAFGFDRLVMLMCGRDSIREVIPFPKTTSGLSKMDGSPTTVAQDTLEELGFKLVGRGKNGLRFEIEIPDPDKMEVKN
ncbi:MAG: aspartate--tRNA ligase [candidate division Zixibacteria bacterium]|nr:aspartate--tRNA ligase [Candidatus Tariuqbacter arcticus]